MRLTQEEYDRLQKRGRAIADSAFDSLAKELPAKRRGMNKTEAAYGAYLELQRKHGYIDWYRFEGMRLKLADGAWFKPDYAVLVDGALQFHEVKGFMREAANVRLKVANEQYPFRFFLVRFERGSWVVKELAK